MRNTSPSLFLGLGLGAIGAALGAASIYVGETDDAPGAALLGLGLVAGCFVFGFRLTR